MSNYDKLLQYGLKISSKKRYTVTEMRKKLISMMKKLQNYEREIVDLVVERLLELKYLDDKQFIEDYITDRSRFKPRGKLLIFKELKHKGIGQDLLEGIFKEKQIDELSMAVEALNRKSRQWQDLVEQKRQQKAFRFLLSRGFGPDAIYKAINRCYNRVTEE